jgi:hypothetical protein
MHYEERQHTIADTEYAVSQHDEEVSKMFFVDVHEEMRIIDPMRKKQLVDKILQARHESVTSAPLENACSTGVEY